MTVFSSEITCLVGQRFGRLVIKRIARRRGYHGYWATSDCDCGRSHFGRVYTIRNGSTTSCGCAFRDSLIRKKKTAVADAAGLIGRRHGRLTVIAASSLEAGYVHCKCDCGVTTYCKASFVKRGAIQSCGCLLREKTVTRCTTHGRYREPEYETWRGMKKRCYLPKATGFKNYGGRGITVCDRWRVGEAGVSGLECFIADMGKRPTADHSINRIDNDGNYEPGNCEWATRSTQTRNQRHMTRFGDDYREHIDSPQVRRLSRQKMPVLPGV